jgi:ribosomal protein L40E
MTDEFDDDVRKAFGVESEVWIRTCQECGYKQPARSPARYATDSWRETKCRKCKSPALDYGSMRERED